MTDFLTFLVGVGVLSGCVAAGYIAGRDAAERKSAATIAHLRNANRRLARERSRDGWRP